MTSDQDPLRRRLTEAQEAQLRRQLEGEEACTEHHLVKDVTGHFSEISAVPALLEELDAYRTIVGDLAFVAVWMTGHPGWTLSIESEPEGEYFASLEHEEVGSISSSGCYSSTLGAAVRVLRKDIEQWEAQL